MITSKFIKEEELLDSLVVDSEGYICGKVDSFDIKPEKIMIKLYGLEMKKVKIPDIDKLTKDLLMLAPKEGLLRTRMPSIEALHERIRTELGLPTSASISTSELIMFAEARKVTIPAEIVDKQVRVDKGSADWNLVDKIGFSEIGKCVLLSEPIEAKRRGIEVSEKVPYYGTTYLSGRTVIDANAKIIGSAVRVLLSVGALGLLIQEEEITKTEPPDIDALINGLIPSMFRSEKELDMAVAKDLKLRGRFTVEEIRSRYLISWAQSKGIDIPKKVEKRVEVKREFSIDWPDIKKIGDVIILNRPIEELIIAKKPEIPKAEVPEEKPTEVPEEKPTEGWREFES